ncbi:serine/threonine-protein phosphatase [Microbacterium sp. VKM Ac-2870]|uniref:PP2C family protein-serine/threonine phosphatase n=1 Tax=Microbacterium sp. VKM Ac-2870 TaxID=2783825 RepID=UPI00188B52D9|nr:protein phosphatase 2C domain-containing protein [Microbacterium sp. VKM Ac-2870]MBF4562748.1 serine/threonine-protein phosphatase [Microbacterium sp. VKM Ac-2870]
MSEAPIVVRVGAATHTGLRRRVNEDAFLADAPLFLVADGMGGHDAGDRASAAVVAEFADLVGATSLAIDQVRAALRRARARVEAIASDGRAAGTTLAGVVVADVGGVGYWLTVNVGDSRTYRFANGLLEQISVDHSVVQELLDAGMLTGEDAATDSRRNEITRAIGAGSDGQADYWMVPAEPGDRILVCSDGLSGELSAERLRDILADETAPDAAATRLIHEALLHGGRDNITAVVVDAVAVSGYDDVYDTAPAGASRGDADGDTRPRAGARGDFE